MAKIVAIKIDVTKIDKQRLYKGQKGTYLDAVVFLNDEQDQYGNNGMITQSVSKEERESGTKGNILGNVKVIRQSEPTQSNPNPQPQNTNADDIPF